MLVEDALRNKQNLWNKLSDSFHSSKLFQVALRVPVQIEEFLHLVVKYVVLFLGEFPGLDPIDHEHEMFDEIASARDETHAEKYLHSEIEFADV